MKPLLEIDAVTKAFGAGAAAKVVLDRVSLKVREGEFVAIVGYSGTGKSTLLSLLAGLMKPDSGSIRLGGTAITGPGTDRGIVFQHYSLLPWLTVAENIRLAVDQVFPHESGEQRAQCVARMISLVHLSHAADKRPHELSGGMKQRVAVARALAMDPKILLLDEPFGALDALTRGTLQEELEKIYEADRKTVVMITNDVDEALLLADRIVPLLPNGSLGESIVVELPRPRERAALIEDPRYRILRNEMTDALRRSGLDAIDATGRLGAPPTVKSNRERAAHKSERGEGEVTTGRGGPFLELRKLNKIYETPRGPQVIVKDIDLTIGEHEFVSIIGHSGCGKTTVLSMVAGLTKPTAGAIVIGGREVRGPGPERAMVFQQHSLLPWLTALENVELGVDSAFSKASAAERRSIAEYALDRVGLFAARNQKPADLSAGMRQRVGVARAFALSPQLLLLDEPFGSLDSVTRAELQDVLLELWGKSRTAALLVTHDIDEAIYLSDRIVLMTDGPAAEIGAILEVKFPRPRDRATIIDLPEYATLRSRMIDFLEHTSASRTQSRSLPSPVAS